MGQKPETSAIPPKLTYNTSTRLRVPSYAPRWITGGDSRRSPTEQMLFGPPSGVHSPTAHCLITPPEALCKAHRMGYFSPSLVWSINLLCIIITLLAFVKRKFPGNCVGLFSGRTCACRKIPLRVQTCAAVRRALQRAAISLAKKRQSRFCQIYSTMVRISMGHCFAQMPQAMHLVGTASSLGFTMTFMGQASTQAPHLVQSFLLMM